MRKSSRGLFFLGFPEGLESVLMCRAMPHTPLLSSGTAVIEDVGTRCHPLDLWPSVMGIRGLLSNYGYDGERLGTQQQYDKTKWKEARLRAVS